MTEEAKASGISPESTEADTLLEQIIEIFEETDREGGENSQQVEQNKENERKKVEKMRNWSMEKLGEALKRKAADDGQVTHKKRGSGTETLVYLRDKAEKQYELRKEELEVKTKEQSQQMQMFKAMQQQMQLHIQQHQLQNRMLLALIEKIESCCFEKIQIGPICTSAQNWNYLDKIEGQILLCQMFVLSAVSAFKFSKRANPVNTLT